MEKPVPIHRKVWRGQPGIHLQSPKQRPGLGRWVLVQIEGILKPLKYGSSPGRIHRRGPGPSLMEEEPAKETEQGWAGRVGNQERVG